MSEAILPNTGHKLKVTGQEGAIPTAPLETTLPPPTKAPLSLLTLRPLQRPSEVRATECNHLTEWEHRAIPLLTIKGWSPWQVGGAGASPENTGEGDGLARTGSGRSPTWFALPTPRCVIRAAGRTWPLADSSTLHPASTGVDGGDGDDGGVEW